MTTKTIEKELLELENKYWQAVKDHDVDTCMSLTDDPCIVSGASGVSTIDRPTFIKIMQSQNYTLHSFSIDDDVQTRMLGDGVAIMAYKVHEKLTVDGKPVEFDAAESSVWRRRGNDWVCSLHTESMLGDAFGRDRNKKT